MPRTWGRADPAAPRGAALFLGLALGLSSAPARGLPPADAAATPPRLRICCALGYDLDLRFGGRRAPVGIQNVLDPHDPSAHRYRARSVFDERNGLIHTCRAGFIDLGHLRAAADLYAHVHARLAETAAPGVIRFALADGAAAVHLFGGLDAERRRIVAQRVAFDLTVWHEIVTGTGGRTVEVFSEAFSALSPEDLYSDLVGTRLGALAVESPWPYDQAMARLTQDFLRAAGAQPPESTRAALDQVDGRWWRSEVPVPDKELLVVRNLAFGPTLTPWRVPDPTGLGCPEAPPLLVSRPRLAPGAEAPGPLYRLELEPPEGSRLDPGPYTPRDFERLMDEARRALAEAPVPAPEPEGASPLVGIRLLPLRGAVGARLGLEGATSPRPIGALEVVGARTEGVGGDLSIIRFASAYGSRSQGLVTHLTGIQADHLFFCAERGSDRVHPPIAAWFQSCAPSGVLGLGFTLAQLQHDGGTGRWAMRPFEAHLSLSLLDDAFDPAFTRRHLVLSAGAALETASVPGGEENLSVRAHAQLRGRLASRDRRWQADLHLAFRPDLLDLDDRGAELGLSLERRVFLEDEARDPIWGVATLGVELAATHWTQPGAALDDHLLPLTPADTQGSLRALLTLGLELERWVF